jgi:hypothetical protein
LVVIVFSFTIDEDSVYDEENQIPDKNKNLHKFIPPDFFENKLLGNYERKIKIGCPLGYFDIPIAVRSLFIFPYYSDYSPDTDNSLTK